MIVREGGPSSGYILTGFYSGLSLGRVMLLPVTKKIGDIYAVYLYILVVFCFQLIVWLVPSFPMGAMSVFLLGFFLGPIYPIVIQHTARVLPHDLVNPTIAWIFAFAAMGNALLSLMAGAMASRWGIESSQPFILAMMVMVFTLWSFLPKSV